MTITTDPTSLRLQILHEPGWLTHHAYHTALRCGTPQRWQQDVFSDAALFVWEKYPVERFDPGRYPRQPGESEDHHRDRVHRKLMAHAGVSLCRWLTQQQKKRRRREFEETRDAGFFVTQSVRPSSARVRGTAREDLEDFALRLVNHKCEDPRERKFLGILRDVVARVLDGEEFEDARRAVCNHLRTWRCCLRLAQKV